jgi:hypothetical protein
MDNQTPTPTPTPQIQDPQNQQPITTPVTVGTVSNSPTVQPAVGVAVATTQQPPVIYSQNESERFTKPHSRKLLKLLSVATLIVLATGAVLYFWVFPSTWSNSYLKTIKPVYGKQADQMSAIYSMFEKINPSINNSTVSTATLQQKYNYDSSAIGTAITLTNTIKSDDHLTVLPGTTWLHSISKANSQYRAMQKYTADSLTFLQDYKLLVNYAWQSDQILDQQIPILNNGLDSLNTSQTLSELTVALNNLTTDLQVSIDKISVLKPSPDLQTFNSNLLSALSGMESALSTQVSDIQNNSPSAFKAQAATYASYYTKLSNLLGSNPLENIHTSSTINSQLTTVKEESPLD